MDELRELKLELEQLGILIAEKQRALYRAEQTKAAIDDASLALALKGITHSLVCPLCGVTLSQPPRVGMTHAGCYASGFWRKGYRSHNDWIRACIENGASVHRFMEKDKEEKNLISLQENGTAPW